MTAGMSMSVAIAARLALRATTAPAQEVGSRKVPDIDLFAYPASVLIVGDEPNDD